RRTQRNPSREADLSIEIAKVLRSASDPGGAAIRLRDALASRPDRVDAQLLLGEVLIELGEADDAVALLEEALRRKPDKPAWALLGRAYEAQGDVSKAAGAFDAAGDAADVALRANALERAGREDESLELWRSLGTHEGRRRAAGVLMRW